mmetsp:Transcript_23069/g.66212  ORF Transcript_23069/g.66212 Transcript_23069/m.66212 type:complete len:314 (+) Transcript_23069:2075-3016(+)
MADQELSLAVLLPQMRPRRRRQRCRSLVRMEVLQASAGDASERPLLRVHQFQAQAAALGGDAGDADWHQGVAVLAGHVLRRRQGDACLSRALDVAGQANAPQQFRPDRGVGDRERHVRNGERAGTILRHTIHVRVRLAGVVRRDVVGVLQRDRRHPHAEGGRVHDLLDDDGHAEGLLGIELRSLRHDPQPVRCHRVRQARLDLPASLRIVHDSPQDVLAEVLRRSVDQGNDAEMVFQTDGFLEQLADVHLLRPHPAGDAPVRQRHHGPFSGVVANRRRQRPLRLPRNRDDGARAGLLGLRGRRRDGLHGAVLL